MTEWPDKTEKTNGNKALGPARELGLAQDMRPVQAGGGTVNPLLSTPLAVTVAVLTLFYLRPFSYNTSSQVSLAELL